MNASTKQLRKYLFLVAMIFLFVVLVVIQTQNKITNENSPHQSISISQSFEIIKTKCEYGESGPRILCAIYTHKAIHNTTLLFAHNTWAKRYLIFFYRNQIETKAFIKALNFNFVNFKNLKMRQNHLYDWAQIG